MYRNLVGVLKDFRRKQTKRMYEIPGFQLPDLFNPYYIDRKTIYDFIQQAAKQYSGDIVLDFGCGNKPYEKLFSCTTYIGCDVHVSGHPDNDKKADVYYEGHNLPFEAEYFDTVLSTQVLEHVEEFDEIFRELVRILKREGFLIITIPFCFEEHEKPYDFRRFTSFGIKKLFEDHGIELLDIKKSTNYKTTIMYMRCMYRDNIYRKKKNLFNFITRYVCCVINNFRFVFLRTNKSRNKREDDDMGINFFVIGRKK